MKITARSVTQGNTVFYETAIPAEELINEENFTPDRWNPISGKGYQREISQDHTRRIARYLSNEAVTNVLPTSVIINARQPLQVTNIGEGIVEIELKKFPLYIIDGQHRIQALREAEAAGQDLSDYELGVTLTNFDLRDEMIHFKNINTRANRAPKALSDVLMGQLADQYGVIPESLEDQATIRATQVVNRLVGDTDSVWHGKVALGGTRRRSYHTTVQSALAQSMKPMFTNGRFSDPTEDQREIYRIFRDFWNALAEVFPEAFENSYTHNIQRSLGFSVWHTVLNRILTNVNFNPTRDQMREAIAQAARELEMTSEFWQVGMTSGARQLAHGYNRDQGIRMVADQIWKAIPREVLKEKARV